MAATGVQSLPHRGLPELLGRTSHDQGLWDVKTSTRGAHSVKTCRAVDHSRDVRAPRGHRIGRPAVGADGVLPATASARADDHRLEAGHSRLASIQREVCVGGDKVGGIARTSLQHIG